MPKAHDQLGGLRVAAPCEVPWEEMAGDERSRHCTLCSLNVYNFAEMTRDEVRELLVRTEGRVCAKLYRRPDGTVLTRDCPTGLRALRRRALRVAAALIATLVSLPVFAFGRRTCEKPKFKTSGSNARLEIERLASPQPAVVNGVVRDDQGSPIPGATITVRDEVSGRELIAGTDAKGAFTIAFLSDGIYRVNVILPGFIPATMEHLELKASEVAHVSVNLRLAAVMGVITVTMQPHPMMRTHGVSTTFSQDFIDKLP